jgi:hypothetical protein
LRVIFAQRLFRVDDTPADVGLGRTGRTGRHSRGLDIADFYRALLEHDLRVAEGKTAPVAAPLTGWQRQEQALEADARQDRASAGARREWRRFQERQRLEEDSGLQHDAEHHHARNTMPVAQHVRVTVAKKPIGRGAMVDRTHESPHVEQSAGASTSKPKLGTSAVTVHRPQGFGAAGGSIVFG